VVKLPPPPPYKVGTAFLVNTQIDFGDHFIGTDTTISVTLKDTTSSLVIVTSGEISGTGKSAFSLTAPASFADTVKGHKSLVFSVKFSPTAEAEYDAALTIHYIDSLKKGEKDSILNVQLTGNGIKKPTGNGVHDFSSLSYDVSIVPNPFTSSTQISVTAGESNMTTLEIRDLLGKDIFSTRAFSIGNGEKYIYRLDAAALHLSPGTYFVIVRSAGKEVTRKLMYLGQ
jgi:hypothetical protein